MKKFILLGLVVAALLNGVFIAQKNNFIGGMVKKSNFKDDSGKKSNQNEILLSENNKNMGEKEKKMLNRDNIEQKYKWNLKDIYPNWDSWSKDVEKMKILMEEVPKYKGKISQDEKEFVKIILLQEELARLVDKIYLYPYLMKDLNSKDTVASQKLQEIEILYTQYGVATSWILPEVLSIPKEQITKWIDENPKLESERFGLMELYRLQSHVLDEKSEKLLSYFSQFNGSVNDIYQELSTSDIKWNKIKLLNDKGEEGEEVTITNGTYSKIVSTNTIQENRKRAFEALYNSYNTNKNTYGAIYRGILQRGDASSKAKNYGSTLERALEPKNISPDIYLSLLKSAKENNAPLKRYVEMRKKYLGLKEYHYYDNAINIIDYDKEFEYEDAKNMVLNSVKPLGEDYSKNLKTAISDGWLDVFETENKRSGAYSINIYDVHPYMLLNYNKTMDSVFTLAHELGHTLHSMYSSKNQPYATSSYTIFVAEVASTFNEKLLLDYMLKTTEDRKERIALLEQAIGNIVGTYYIQVLFADYEYQAHKMVEDGKPVVPEVLDALMTKLFTEYFGNNLAFDDLQKIIWSRIPHFYNSPYYVYQYATSFSASSNLYDKITNEKYSEADRNKSREAYLELLKSGGNDHPMNQLKKAGVDLSNTESFAAVSKDLDRLLDLLEKELKEEKKN